MRRRSRHPRGFTLIELVIVISMILVLLSIALPMYNKAILRSKEARLHQNLVTLNQAIEHYSLDKHKAPQALGDLVPDYIRFIPDDITSKPDTWQTEQEDLQDCYDPNQCGIRAVHSGSSEISSEGTEYSSWTH